MIEVNVKDIKKQILEIKKYTLAINSKLSPSQFFGTAIEVKNDTMVLTAGTEETILRYKITIDSTEEKNALVATSDLVKVIKAFKGDLKISFNKEHLVVAQGNRKFRINYMDESYRLEFPKHITNTFTIDFDIRSVMNRLGRFTKKFKPTPVVNYIYFCVIDGATWAMATDTSKAGGIKVSDKPIKSPFLIKPYVPIESGDPITIGEANSFLVFMTEKKVIYHRKFPVDKFPPIERLFDLELPNAFWVSKEDIYSSMDAARKLVDGENIILELDINDDIKIRAYDATGGHVDYTDTIPLEYSSKPIKVRFGSIVLFDMIEFLDLDIIKIHHDDLRFFYMSDTEIAGSAAIGN